MSTTIVYLLAEDFLFMSHFVERALAAKARGWRVIVAAREGQAAGNIRALGLEFAPLDFRRRSLNPVSELRTIRQIGRLYRETKPDIVHHIALKPIIYGAIAARMEGVRSVVNAPIGMGFVFTSATSTARVLRPIALAMLRFTLNPAGSWVIFENTEDRDSFVGRGYVRKEDSALIEGAGVDLELFHPRPEPPGPPVIVLAARMLAPKGVRDLVEAAAILKRDGVAARVQLAGAPDPGNPETIGEDELRGWHDSGLVEWLGQRSDMADVYGAAHIACLPSYYGEGLPRTLLEAMAAGLPIVTTDNVGCRSAVTDGENGILVPPRDPQALATALRRLIEDPALRANYGSAGRKRAEERFGLPLVISQTLSLYDGLLARAKEGA